MAQQPEDTKIDITRLSVTELKSLAYDEFCKITVAQNNKAIIEVRINELMTTQQEIPNAGANTNVGGGVSGPKTDLQSLPPDA